GGRPPQCSAAPRLVHPQVAEAAVPIGLRGLVEEGARAEPLDESAQLAPGDRLPSQVDLVDRDPALLEEANRGARRLLTLVAEDLDAEIGHRPQRSRAEAAAGTIGPTGGGAWRSGSRSSSTIGRARSPGWSPPSRSAA